MRFHSFVSLFVACTIGLQVNSVRADRRPEAPPPPPPPVVEKPPKGFLEAYQALGSPRLLIYAYMLPMDDTNELGTLKAFEGRLRPYFIHPDVTVSFQNASQFRDQREFGELVAKNSIEAAKLVSRDSPADYVILVSFIRQGGREGNVKYTQTYEILDMNRGAIVGTHSWETSPTRGNQDGVVDVRRLEQYAQALAVKMTEDFMKIAGPGRAGSTRNFTLRITGLRDARLAQLRTLLRQVKGVKDVIRPKQDDKGAQFDVRFAGDPLDFSEAVREAVEAGLDMNASFLLTDEGLVIVEVWPRMQPANPSGSTEALVSPSVECEALLNGDQESPGTAAQRTRFAKAYAKGNEPRIGIMINKDASKDDAKEPERPTGTSTAPAGTGGIGSHNQAGQNTVVCIQCKLGESGAKEAPAPTAAELSPTDDAYLNAREMEDRLFRRFGVLKLERVDLKVAFNNLRAQQKLTKEVYDEGELAQLLGEEAQAQVVIAGAGKVVRSLSNVEVRFTFRAYEMGSARILATATVNRTINSRVSDVNEATESMAAETIGKLACQMMDMWEPPNRIKVELSGAKSAKDVIEAMRAIQKVSGVERTIFRGFVEGKEKPGVGFMQIIYSTKCEDLISRIAETAKLPFQLDNRSTNCDTLRLKAVEK